MFGEEYDVIVVGAGHAGAEAAAAAATLPEAKICFVGPHPRSTGSGKIPPGCACAKKPLRKIT